MSDTVAFWGDSFANYGGTPAKAEYSHEGVSRRSLVLSM